MLNYHVFRKPKKLKNGKSVRRWYYYYYDETGRQIQKSCGKNIKSRNEAEDFVRALPPPGTSGGYALPMKNPDMLIKEIAEKMFLPGSAHVNRRKQLKKSVTAEALYTNRVFMKHIIATWGNRTLRSLELDEVMNYLFSVELSASWKNQYISALNEIYQEGQFLGCKVYKPNFPSIGKTENKADIFTEEELNRFFKRENFSHDFFYLFFLCSLSGGQRLGETRAMRPQQIIFDKKAVIIDGYLKSDGTRTNYNKKGSPEHPKFRVVLYPDFTLNLLQNFVTSNRINPDDFIFTYNGHPLGKTMIETAFNNALIKSGIARDKEYLVNNGFWQTGHFRGSARDLMPDGRQLIHHSLRYTYVTRMSLELDAHNLKKLTGHDSVGMVDYYNRKNLDLILAAIPNASAAMKVLLPAAITA